MVGAIDSKSISLYECWFESKKRYIIIIFVKLLENVGFFTCNGFKAMSY